MHCKRAKEHISLFIDGRLDPPEQARLNEHLERCPDCSSYLDDLKAGLAMLHGEGFDSPSGNFEWNLRRKIQMALAQREDDRLFDMRDRRDPWRFGLSAAAALLVVVSAGVFWYQSQFGFREPGASGGGMAAGSEAARQGRPGWMDPAPGGMMPVTDRIGGPTGVPADRYSAESAAPRSASPADSITGSELD